ncbi:YopX family protein [Colwellia sp. MSW7]|uniref:YopX family protein n=1 Tax=Colwellia maritima TaxID=2912588 RepID=A0ABS9X781_9GAMM|nr:YopX family protein [Colwellia maritima]MCI2286081.1 YopX family protein [Colwellia maritima]
MREIKFRAKAIVNDIHNNIKVGDFVQGQYIESGCDAPCIIFGDGEQIEVDRKTLGQFIGEKDCSGNSIYEGDIVSKRLIDNSVHQCVVRYSEKYAKFVYCPISEEWDFDRDVVCGPWERKGYKVVGTIHSKK